MSDRDDITAYLLGELDPTAAERVRAREASDRGFAAELARMRAVVADVAALEKEHWSPAEPPALQFAAPARRARRGAWGAPLVLRPAFAAAVAVVLVAMGVAAGALLTRDSGGSSDAGRRVALAPIGQTPTAARAVARLDGATLHLTVRGLPPTADGDFYEVWMLRTPKDLVAMGTFRVGRDGAARIDLPIAASARQFPVLDVSLERPDGDPAHSGDSVLRSKPLVS
jgi:anti-sigma-K factor RskA